MKRTLLGRRSSLRRRPRRREARPLRLGEPVTMGPGWAARCKTIRERDGHKCRRCGQWAQGALGHIDHILPRRLFDDYESANADNNLALLCNPCHGIKTYDVEARLLGGDPHPFYGYRQRLNLTGPVPNATLVGAALDKLRRLLERTWRKN